MLDICIPVFNYEVTSLVHSLHQQCTDVGIDFSILIFEDGSSPEFIKKNNTVEQKNNIEHYISAENIGRSAARNFLINKTKKSHILFLDCDSELPDSNFISNYIKNSEQNVVCGGTKYNAEQKQNDCSLRYKYGINREMISATKRNTDPNSSFAANNFMIKAQVLEKVRFREFLKGYGHEDSLFGYELKKNLINIHHIDNPVIHVGIEENDIFLRKTEQGIKNLILIELSSLVDKDFTNDIKIIKFYNRLKTFHALFVPRIIFKLFNKEIKKHLTYSKNPCLVLFDLYKIGYYCKLKNMKNEK